MIELKLGLFFLFFSFILIGVPLYMLHRQSEQFESGSLDDYVDYEAQQRGSKLLIAGGGFFLLAGLYFLLMHFLE